MPVIADVVRALVGQERAVSNARAAATDLSRRRVERLDVELYLTERAAARDVGDGTGDRVPVSTGDRVGVQGDDTLAARRG